MTLKYRVSDFQSAVQRWPIIDLAFCRIFIFKLSFGILVSCRILVFKLSFDFPIDFHLLLFYEIFLMKEKEEGENILKIRLLLENAEFSIYVKSY